MSETRYIDVIEPSVFLSYQAEQIPEKYIMMMQSGILAAPVEEVMRQVTAGGTLIDMPYWDDLGRDEPEIPDDDPNAEITPDKITADNERATKHQLVKAWSAMDMAGMVATGNAKDPIMQIAMGTNRYWYFTLEHRIIATLTGVLADNSANDSSDMIATVYSDVSSPTAANKISVAAVNEAKLTMGDHMDDFRVICMHSHVYNTLLNDEKIDFVKPSDTPYQVPTYLNMLVLFSDQMPVVAGSNSNKYTCYLLGEGAFAFNQFMDPTPTPNGTVGMEKERKPLVGSGGGQDIIIQRQRQFLHPRGISWTNASRAKKMGATRAELALAANWDRKYVRKNIKIAALEVNI